MRAKIDPIRQARIACLKFRQRLVPAALQIAAVPRSHRGGAGRSRSAAACRLRRILSQRAIQMSMASCSVSGRPRGGRRAAIERIAHLTVEQHPALIADESSKLMAAPGRSRGDLDVILFPAIDLKGGKCVRLRLGDMATATVFNDDPAAQAKAVRDTGLSLPAPGRPRRRLRGTPGQRGRRRRNSEERRDPGATRRWHPRSRHDRGLAGQGRKPRHSRYHRGA